MRIGVPKALNYYRYGTKWRVFFEALGCRVVESDDTNRGMMAAGIDRSVGECCLPLKVWLGHIHSLLDRCDYILVPRFERLGDNEEFCVRFWGLPDIARSTFPGVRILSYDLRGERSGGERAGFLALGGQLGKSREESLRAYRLAVRAQSTRDLAARARQERVLARPGLKVLVAAHPYVAHDACIGAPLVRMLRGQGAVPVFADRCDRRACRTRSRELSRDLFWTLNKEVLGAIPLLRDRVDGVLLLTAFPCGTDSMANELALRRLRGLPAAHIVLDEQQAEAGFETRVECFVDILRERGKGRVS